MENRTRTRFYSAGPCELPVLNQGDARLRSRRRTCIEHSLYGWLIFTVWLGRFFYTRAAWHHWGRSAGKHRPSVEPAGGGKIVADPAFDPSLKFKSLIAAPDRFRELATVTLALEPSFTLSLK